MIYTNTNITKFAFIFLLLGTLSFALVQCSSSTDSSDGGGGGNGGGGGGNNPPTTSFDSGVLTPGQSFSYTFTEEGVTNYVCTIHPSMTGTVTVESGASSEPVTVVIDNLSFNPSEITIGPDTEVTWVNQDDVNHTATSSNSNDSGNGDPGNPY